MIMAPPSLIFFSIFFLFFGFQPRGMAKPPPKCGAGRGARLATGLRRDGPSSSCRWRAANDWPHTIVPFCADGAFIHAARPTLARTELGSGPST